MNFGFSQDQQLLKEQVQRFVRERCPMPRVRAWCATETGYDREVYAELASLGFAGLTVPEAQGGAGLGFVEVAVVLEALGSGLVPGPLSSTLVTAAALSELGGDALKRRLLPDLAQGGRVGTLALFEGDQPLSGDGVALTAELRDGELRVSGQKDHVPDAAAADVFVVALNTPKGLALAVIERDQPGVSTRDHAVIDRSKRLGRLPLTDVPLGPQAVLVEGDGAAAAYQRLFDQGVVALCAEMLGAAEAVHGLTVGYAKERTQFGRPIGQYQGVKHPLAEMYVDIQTFRSLLYYAAWSVTGAPQELSRAASMAKAYGSEAFGRIGIDSIQLHGAIGYTAEYDAQLYLKRSKLSRACFGDSDFHYARVASLGGV